MPALSAASAPPGAGSGATALASVGSGFSAEELSSRDAMALYVGQESAVPQ